MSLKVALCSGLTISAATQISGQVSIQRRTGRPYLLLKYAIGTEVHTDVTVTVRPDNTGLAVTDWFALSTFFNVGVNPDDSIILRLDGDSLLCIPLELDFQGFLRITIKGNTVGITPGSLSAWIVQG